MKHILILITALFLFALVGCKASEANSSTGGTESFPAAANTENSSATGNTEHTASTEGQEIPADVELAMKTAYQKRYADAAHSIRYYGCYDGAHVGFVDGNGEYGCAITKDVICGLIFVYPSTQKLDVYKDGEILKLKEAYEAGWFTADGLKQLLDYYKTVKFYLYEE